jgi:ribosome maturation factor RimP
MNERIKELLTPTAKDFEAEIVSIKWMPTNDRKYGRNQLEIRLKMTDDSSVSIDLCSKFSRRASAVLDVEDIIKSEYELIVSSPGV